MTQISSAEISVIIVNYNTADLVLEGIQSVLERDHGGRLVDVHVVDNASPNGDGAALEAAIAEKGWGRRVTLYAETINHGFGRGNNRVLHTLAARSTPPEFVFLLNPDARLENEAIDTLAFFIAEHPKIGAAGARIEKPGGIPVIAAFRFPVMLSEFSKGISFGPISRMLRKWDVPLGADLPTGQVGWVAGAAVMFRFSALLETGFFDPDYFLYYEEVDLMKKLDRHGWGIWYVAEAQVIHAEGAATGVKSGDVAPKRRPAYWYESWRLYFHKNHGRAYALASGGLWMLGSFMNTAISRLRRRQPAAPSHFVHDFWSMGMRPLLGLKARPYE
ncbi:MAG: glycosyltransferase family 2 protein [Pseudomonadota bacterium]